MTTDVELRKARLADSACSEQRPLTDLGNAERFADQHRGTVVYAPHRKAWMAYDGRRWVPDELQVAKRLAGETARKLLLEAAGEPDRDRRAELVDHARASESAPRLRAMLELAQPMLAKKAGDFDAEPLIFNVLNGTIDLRTMELRPHRPEDLITKVAPVAFEPGATCPRWDAFLDRILPDAGVRAFVQSAAGYFMTPSVQEHALFIGYGGGANGKSVFLTVLQAIWGDYCKTAEASTFLAQQGDRIRNDLAALHGARLVSISEIESGRRLAESLVKQATGGDTVTARFLYGEYFQFVPSFKILMATNHMPGVRGVGEGIWRRIRVIPFTVTIPEGERDKSLTKKLLIEASGILNWAIAGCRAWQQDGLQAPAAVRDASSEYRADQDPIGTFLDERCVLEPAAHVTVAALYSAYVRHAEAACEQPLKQRAFAEALRAHQCEPFRSNRARGWKGIGLVAEGDAVTHRDASSTDLP